MKTWKELNEKDKKQLLRYPLYISLLASASRCAMDKQEKDMAIKLTHIKTFAPDPELFDFYKAAEHGFEKQLTEIERELPVDNTERREIIKQKLARLEMILQQLDTGFAIALRHSMESYKNHISRAHQNVLEYFIFPLPINGVSD